MNQAADSLMAVLGYKRVEGVLTLHLPFPPSGNTYYRRSAHATYLSAKGREFKERVAEIVAEAGQRIEGRLQIFMSLYAPTKRKYDIDNRIKATLDALQDAGVFEDDEQVDKITVKRCEVVKGGRCVVLVMAL